MPSLGAEIAGEALPGWLIAAGFLLVGLAPTSRARVSADALVAWLKLAFKHLDAWRCRCAGCSMLAAAPRPWIWPEVSLALMG